MSIDVKLEQFEGPLDLLLHLIDKNKIDIYDIPISQITDQYMEYVKQLDTDNMDVTSEFMVMAATLIDIKCKMLLPQEVDDNGEDEDPRSELVRRLLEYKMYKTVSGRLRTQFDEAGDLISREMMLPKEVIAYHPPVNMNQLLEDISLQRLREVFQFVLQRQEFKIDPVRSRFGTIEKEDISLPKQLEYVADYARKNRHFSFQKLLTEQKTKMKTIVTFLAILELMKSGTIRISQKEIFGEIEIDLTEVKHERAS